ncbi:MAG: hypothetical protein ACRYFA_08440 [Janthinobacterium lividum]
MKEVSWHHLRTHINNNNGNMTLKNSIPDKTSEEKDWEDPLNPENPSDSRNEEQFTRQVNEAKRRKNNLTEKDHIDKPRKTGNDK